MSRDYVVGIIDRSLARLGSRGWIWCSTTGGTWQLRAVETAQVLHDLMKQGKIARLGVTNFNTDQFAQLIDAGSRSPPINCNTLLDRRPDWKMNAYCQRHGVRLLTYGHLLVVSFRRPGWASPSSRAVRESILDQIQADHRRVRRLGLFQRLLQALQRVGDRHGVGIGEVPCAGR